METYRIIENEMAMMRDDAQVVNLSRFFKTGPGQYGEGDKFLGIKVPGTREIAKKYWKECELDDVARLLASPYHEIRLAALLILVQQYHHARRDDGIRRRIVDFYLSHTATINNWDLVDLSCYEILGAWARDHSEDRHLLTDLARDGATIWEQRIGMVGTMALVRAGEFDECLECADILLHHDHDLIHKAVGWLLRDVGNRDGALLREFLSPRYRTMPRTMLRYAIEKFPEPERQLYLSGQA